MAAASCLVCGGEIRIDPYDVPRGVIARGDRFMHEGCVFDTEAAGRPHRAGCPAYFIPRGW